MALNGGIHCMVRKLSNLLYMQPHCGYHSKVIKCWKWEVRPFTTLQWSTNYAVLILNRPVSQSPEFLKQFWNDAAVRMTVDGGTLQWDLFVRTLPGHEQTSLKPPDLVAGDFDSITEEMLDQYKKKGCKIIHTPDQNYTDFVKCLKELNTYCNQENIEMDKIVAIGQCSGRIDQVIGNIQALFLAKEKQILSSNAAVYLMSDDSISWLLYPGDHVIHIPECVRQQKRPWCSIVPIGEACESVTTSGLKWNLDNQTLKFGGIVSTSNTYNGSDTVTIKCSHPVLWSMKIPNLISRP